MVVLPVFAAGEKEGGGSAEYDYVFGKVPYTLEHAYHQSETKTLSEYAEKMYNAKVIIIDGEASTEATLSAIENLISRWNAWTA